MKRVGFVVLIAAALSACERPPPIQCPGYEYHPLVQEFSTVPVGQSMMFSSSSGAVVGYRLESIENSEPYVSYSQSGHLISSSDPEDCVLTSIHTYVSPELDTTLLMEFGSSIVAGVSAGDQLLGMSVRVTKTGAAPRSIGSSFRYPLTLETASDYADREFYPSRVYGQTEYTDVLEETKPPGHPIFDFSSPPEVLLSRMAISKGAGIVEFEQVDGVVYTKIPP